MRRIESKKFEIYSTLNEEEALYLKRLLKNKEIDSLVFISSLLVYFDDETKKLLENNKFVSFEYMNFYDLVEKIDGFYMLDTINSLIKSNNIKQLKISLKQEKETIYHALEYNNSLEYLYIMDLKFDSWKFSSLQKMMNNNTKLHSLTLEQIVINDGKYLEYSLFNQLNDNYSLTYLNLRINHSILKDHSFFKKFRMLRKLKLYYIRYKMHELIKNLSLESHPFLYSLKLSDPHNPYVCIDFSNTAIINFDFIEYTYIHYMTFPILKNVKKLKIQCYPHFGRKGLNLEFYDFLSQSNHLEVLTINKVMDDITLLCKSINGNTTLKKIHFNIDSNGFEKEIGQALNSIHSLENVYLSKRNLNAQEFFNYFKGQSNLKRFEIFGYKNNKTKIGNRVSEFIMKNEDLEYLRLDINITEECFESISEAILSHKKIQTFYCDEYNTFNIKYVTKIIKNNRILKELSLGSLTFENEELENFLNSLSRNASLTSLYIAFIPSINDQIVHNIFINNLFYNYNLTYCMINNLQYPFENRNCEFITNLYKIPESGKNIYFTFND